MRVKMITAREMIDMNTEELCKMAHNNNWDMETFQAWSMFKIAQYLEKLVRKGGEDAKP